MYFCLCGIVCAQMQKHVVILGDSNTWLGGDKCDKPQGWNKWFKELAQPLSCTSYARSGATWTHTSKTVYDIMEDTGILSDNNVIYNQINRLVKACEQGTQPLPDLIIIMAGTNDLWFADKRPDCLSKWIGYDGELLSKAFPKARLVLITPPPFVKVGMERQHQAAEEIAECAEMLHADVIRLDQCDKPFSVDKMLVGGYSKDGVHTTVKGAQVLGTYIYEQMMAIALQ